jgi:hypothetical protein
MPQVLPLEAGNPNYRFGTTLGGEPFLIDILWNERDSAWYMSILSEDEQLISSGLKLVLGGPIGDNDATLLFPPGHFYLFDSTGSGTDPTFEDIGIRVNLYFYTEEDLEEFEA